jgi:hypothetical protein
MENRNWEGRWTANVPAVAEIAGFFMPEKGLSAELPRGIDPIGEQN